MILLTAKIITILNSVFLRYILSTLVDSHKARLFTIKYNVYAQLNTCCIKLAEIKNINPCNFHYHNFVKNINSFQFFT